MADASDTETDQQVTLVQRAVSTAIRPVEVLTSRSAVKAYLSTLLFFITSIGLLTLSTTAYGFFYYNYIPQINLERTIYLQYDHGSHPYATTALDTTTLISQQPYDIELILHMPRTPANLAAGNFMLDLSLITEGPPLPNMPPSISQLIPNITTGTLLHHSRRPTILPFSSPILGLGHTLTHLPLHLLSLRDLDSCVLITPMFELLSFGRGTRNIPTHVRLELQSLSTLQIYSATIAFRARFKGLRYLIYNHRILAFTAFTTVFYTVAIATLAIAWAFISSSLSPSNPWQTSAPDKIKQEPDTITSHESNGHLDPKAKSKAKAIKNEPNDEDEYSSSTQGLSLSNLSDTPAHFPSGRGQMALRFPLGVGGSTTPPAAATAPVSNEPPTRPSEAADDEDEDGDQGAGRSARDVGDSGIGTSMESEHVGSGVVRKRGSRQSLGRG